MPAVSDAQAVRVVARTKQKFVDTALVQKLNLKPAEASRVLKRLKNRRLYEPGNSLREGHLTEKGAKLASR